MLSLVKFAEIVTLNRLLTVMQTHFQNVSDDNSIKSRKDYGACSFLSKMKSSSWARFADLQFSFSIYWTRGNIKEIICFVFNRTSHSKFRKPLNAQIISNKLNLTLSQ